MKKYFFFSVIFLVTSLIFAEEPPMLLTSLVFQHNATIPRDFTCQGQDINPALTIANIPVHAKSLALIVDDPDAPMGTWVHWVVFNVPAPSDGKLTIKENSIPGTQGWNDFGRIHYGGPCPPSGTHRYFFKAYALDTQLNLQ